MVDLGGYVIILVETKDKKIKLYGRYTCGSTWVTDQGVVFGITLTCHTFISGSPADKADLEVGDEILEVNGRSMEEATHTEVISHIHQVG